MSCWDKFRGETKIKADTFDKICRFFSEVIGTAMLIFLGCMGCVSTSTFHNTHLQMTLNFGLVVMIIVQCFGCVSGAHLNPAVTAGAYIYNKITAPMAIIYFCGQMLGSCMGYGLLKAVLPDSAMSGSVNGLCVTTVHPDMTAMQGCGVEIVLTATLVLLCCGIWDPRNAKFGDSVPITFGLTVACLSITGGQFTGASINPARSFGPALWNNNFRMHWVYWIGPMTGSVIAALGYKIVFRREVKVEEEPLS